MTDPVRQIIRHLYGLQTMQDIAEKAQLTDNIRQLQEWQCQRLLCSHQDLYQNPEFTPAMQFFVDELYGPKDFSQRDQDLARIIPKMGKLLPNKALESLAVAVQLNALSFELDFALSRELGERDLNADNYAQAYRDSNNAQARQQQIDAIQQLGNDLADVIHIRGIGTLLSISRRPAKLAGVLSLHEFIENGYKAFKHITHIDNFLQPVISRERAIMRALLEGKHNPLPQF